ncbi:Re/Si-specific NAD(P)(+) transhydrogenase subunit alpha [Pontibacter sp. SGAir0037]|uniref:Re/Si-specific NAD(P)(+) transhydrogenase subunit alpha n=1 Tax=Pontibacter sp. SGAir0037 TaxID=2571030 RepID=UPI0010CCD885|nr:Re/Si-specific NAD(P)(+) transhydrogenase subunit alpha [Pontibacter sp. SGAir0037]QCR22238.1 NAD(P)(+) transhydrogenase (Re/Si-specific) subunit alpha [Pontibacter sp. SGAir0037]
MNVAVVKESKVPEQRVALSPDVVKSLTKAGFKCGIESGAGMASGFYDSAYENAGGIIFPDKTPLLGDADVLLKVNAPTPEEVLMMREGSAVISFLYAYTVPEVVDVCLQKKISAFAMDAVPRISRAQKMDALSSQANLGGYKAVLLGANALGKIFPLMMTAAGTITPARVLIFGAGVAGLQAIATAKRLGAVVEVTDVRPETKEQVESLGGRFLEVQAEGVKTEGGYAKEVSAEYLQKQKELISKHIADADLVITTALVIGKKAPILVTEEMVASMKPGSVIVDMAVESGGNCALSEFNQTVVKHGVTIIGEANLPAMVSVNASELYAKNISTLLLHLAGKDGFKWELEEEITKGSLITHQGKLVHQFTKEILAKTV